MFRGVQIAAAALGLAALCGGVAQAQDVKYEKYKLDNGMTVILHEDHGLPVASINLWYHVGSKDEPAKRSGFAHLFEHLMFMGTQRVPGSKFDTIMESAGGSNNATTSSDRTNYFSSGPAQLLPTLLWLDADRLEDLARTMDQEKLDKQRDVVRNERRQSYENRPYGKAELRLPELLYPAGHPYHIPVIGTHEDLEAATVTDVKDFFATHYVPNNLSLCVAGDFDPAKIKPLIADLFGTLPRKADAPHRKAEPAKVDKVIRETLRDKVQVPKIIYAYHSPARFAEGDAEMDLMAAVLSEGKTSRLYKRLVYDDKIAAEVSAYQDSSQLGSVFRIDVLAQPEADLERVERTVDEELKKVVEVGISEHELEQRKASFELGMLSRLQTIEAKADQLNEYEYYWGEPNSFKRDLDRYRNATPDSVKKWAKQVLTPEARAIVRVLPEVAAEASATRPESAKPSVETKPQEKIAEAPPRTGSPRDVQPTIGPAPAFKVESPQTFKLSNNIPVMLWSDKELPLVAMWVIFRPGHILGDKFSAGAVYLAADMLDEGAGRLDALDFSDALLSLGTNFSTSADRESMFLTLTVLKRNFEKAAQLSADAIRKPKLDKDEWERVRRLHLEELKQQDDQPAIVASRVASRALFGNQHLYGWPVVGTPETVGKMALDPDIKLPYISHIRPEFATVLLAGDINADEAKNVLNKTLGDWKLLPLNVAKPEQPATPDHAGLQVFLVDRPDAVQTVIQFAMPGPKYSDQFRVQYRLLNTLFGGSFTSRLNMNLREEHGYTYGARSGFVMRKELGYVTASSSVRADVTGESLKEFLAEFRRVRGGDISAEEAVKARETLRTDIIQSFSGLNGILAEAEQRLAGGVPYETLARDMTTLQSATTEELNKLAAPALPFDKGVLVLVGDKKLILDEIKDLGLPAPVEVTVRGDKVGS
jgi:predicted Zn-dependent peptidase